MSHDVFISYSSLDKPAADAVCHGLEARGIRCWIAPRDQFAGQPYGEQIASAIQESRVMVLVFSENVNKSHAVHNEVDLAASANVTIVPFRIAHVEFNAELHFYLGRMHWLDAFPQPIDNYIDNLAATVQRNLTRAAPRAEASQPPTASAAIGDAPPATAEGPPKAAAEPAPVVAEASPPPPPPPPPVAPRAPEADATLPPAPKPAKTDLRPLMIAGGVFGIVVVIALAVALAPQPAANTTVPSANQVADINALPAVIPGNSTVPPAVPASAPAAPGTVDPSSVTYYEAVVTPDGPPAQLAGATVVNTEQLALSLKQRAQGTGAFQLIDARGCTSEPTIPGAVCLNPNTLDQLVATIPNRSTQLVIFCHDGKCPMSYTLASEAVAAGYDNVFWYRGGINAWMAAGNPTSTFSANP